MPNPQHFPNDPEDLKLLGTVSVRTARDGYVLVSMPIDDDWLAIYRVVSPDGNPTIGAVFILPKPTSRKAQRELQQQLIAIDAAPRGGINARMLRSLRVGVAQDLALDVLQEHLSPAHLRGFHGIEPELLAAQRHRGRKGNDDEFYARMAAAYVAALSGKAPVVRVADEMGFSRAYVRDVIHKARVRGLLTEAPRGQAGGTLTDKARAVLGDES